MVKGFIILPYIVADIRTLEEYRAKKKISFENIKRHLYLCARDYNFQLPDQYYKLQLEKEMSDLNSLSLLLSNGISKLASHYLEFIDSRILIKTERLNDWQTLTKSFPPIILSCHFLITSCSLCFSYDDIDTIHVFIDTILKRNFEYSALPKLNILQFNHFVEEQGGISDLHLHMNGTIQAQWVWLEALNNPESFCNRISSHEALIELLEQSNGLVELQDLFELLMRARELRAKMFLDLFKNSGANLDSCSEGSENPFLIFVDKQGIGHVAVQDLYAEILLHLFIGKRLIEEDELLASMYHEYLLSFNYISRLLIQQPNQFGFNQFLKISSSRLRDYSEKSYVKQFLQLLCNSEIPCKLIEGRFSPQSTITQSQVLIKRIIQGWVECKEILHHNCQLTLIGHFIKRLEITTDNCQYRYQLNYSELSKRAETFISIYEQSKNSDYFINNHISIVGVDAAGSEFLTPPAIIAPIFRELRRRGIPHFTFHAGEDFYSVIGGLRAIYEAIDFCELAKGDRIGHASAAGINPSSFYHNVSSTPILEYFNDIIFVYTFITEQKICSLYPIIPLIVEEIHKYCLIIYDKEYPIPALIEAWRLKKYHPHIVFSRTDPPFDSFWYNEDEYYHCRKLTSLSTNDCNNYSLPNLVFEIFTINQGRDFNNRYKTKLVHESEIIPFASIITLQKSLLRYMHAREIVIEALPSSNISVGPYTTIDDYHLWNWLRWEEEGECIPPIVLGSDDPGIFSTSIQIEYARLYSHMVYALSFSHEKAISVLSRFEKNARTYCFQ